MQHNHQEYLQEKFSFGKVSLDCRVSPGIDPEHFIGLCRYLAGMKPAEFSAASLEFMKHHRNLKVVLKRQVKNLINSNRVVGESELPLVSAGPSGIRGQFQREIG